MSNIFDNVMLEDFSYMTEGDQADAYRARKAAERAASEKEGEDYRKNRWKETDKLEPGSKEAKKASKDASASARSVHIDHGPENSYERYRQAPGNKMTKDNPNYGWKHPIKTTKGRLADEKRNDQARDIQMDKTGDRSYKYKKTFRSDTDRLRADDATNRHLRRHPKNESVGFLLSKYEPEYYY